MIRFLLVIFIISCIFLSVAIAQEIKCPKGYQPYSNWCVSQQMVDYLVCVQISGANRKEIVEEVAKVGSEKKSIGGKVSGSGPTLSGSISGTLDKALEKTLVNRFETRWFPNGMSECRKFLERKQAETRKKKQSTALANDETKKSDLDIEPAVNIHSEWSGNVKDTVDLVYNNRSSLATAIMSIELKTKTGSTFKKIGEAQGIQLPFNIDGRKAGKITFPLNKDDIEQLAHILVRDMDKHEIIKEQTVNAYVELQGISAIASLELIATVARNVKVIKNKTVAVFDNRLSILVEKIESTPNSDAPVVNATFSAPGKKNSMISSIKIGDCLSYAGYIIRLKSVSPDAAEFLVSDETSCE